MRLLALPKLARLLTQLANAPDHPPGAGPHAADDIRAGELRDVTGAAGMRYDEYAPAESPRTVVVALHGLTGAANRDRRLVHFARSLAASGARCVVPRLPALSECIYDPGDIAALASLLESLCRGSGVPVGVVGFSYGGSFALLAAAHPAVAESLRFVLAFGAYHHLADLMAPYSRPRPALPVGEPEGAGWDDEIYLRLTLAWARRHDLGLSPPVQEELHRALIGYCGDLPPADKRALFDRHLARLDVPSLIAKTVDRRTADALSPAGKLAGLRCPVSLIHDRQDHLIPPEHAHRLYAELQQLPNARQHRLLVTGLLSHVSWASRLAPIELARLVAAVAPLVE